MTYLCYQTYPSCSFQTGTHNVCYFKIFLDETQRKKTEEDGRNAVDMRKKAMERFGETKKRKIDEGERVEDKRKRRRSRSDTIEFLKCQSELKERELELEIEKQARDEQRHDDWKNFKCPNSRNK